MVWCIPELAQKIKAPFPFFGRMAKAQKGALFNLKKTMKTPETTLTLKLRCFQRVFRRFSG